MAQTDHETEVASADEPSAEMPLPTDPKTIFLGGLFALALLATAYVAGEIVLPMVFAFTLKLLLQPLLRILERFVFPWRSLHCCSSWSCLERSSALVRQFRGPLRSGRVSFPKVFPASRSASVSCARPSIRCNISYNK